ncbi:MAG: hypothetical protein ACJ8G1_09350 [Vitreoscilla sp.]
MAAGQASRWGYAAAACALLLCTADPARGASSSARDAAGNQWRAVSDPSDDAQGYVLERLGANGQFDPAFGRGGRRPLSIDAADDAPSALRVDDRGRIWVTGASIAGAQPQVVVLRYLSNGAPDLHWGVQGKAQVSPAGLAIKPNDLLPLSDGSLLVAGVAANVEPARAVVLHLKGNGLVDTAFGTAGLWQRFGATDGSTATHLSAADNGAVAVCVVARGEHPVAEIWSIAAGAQQLVHQQALDPNIDGEGLRVAWSNGRWSFGTGDAPTVAGLPATLDPALSVGAPGQATPASAPSDPGQGGFSPFAADHQVGAPTASGHDESRSGSSALEWAPWAALGAVVVFAGVFFGRRLRSERPSS